MGKGRASGRWALQEEISPFCTFSLCVRVRVCVRVHARVCVTLKVALSWQPLTFPQVAAWLQNLSLPQLPGIRVIKHLSQKAAVSIQGEDVYTAHGSQPDSQQACGMGKLFLNSAFIHSLARVCVCAGGTFYSKGQAGGPGLRKVRKGDSGGWPSWWPGAKVRSLNSSFFFNLQVMRLWVTFFCRLCGGRV